jgi:uncharacterized protein (DUF488 family)
MNSALAMRQFTGRRGMTFYAGRLTDASNPIFTIGHSSRPQDAFLALLAESDIQCVADIRHLPGSRAFPQYNSDALAAALAAQDIDYWHLDALSGRRSKRALNGAPPQDFWCNASFALYAVYARGAAFAQGLRELLQRARQQRCALMCSEAVWWCCHRRIIIDHLLAMAGDGRHIMGPGKAVPATLTRGAQS